MIYLPSMPCGKMARPLRRAADCSNYALVCRCLAEINHGIIQPVLGQIIEPLDQGPHIGDGQRAAEQIALRLLHPRVFDHSSQLFLGFDALGDHGELKVTSQPGRCSNCPSR